MFPPWPACADDEIEAAERVLRSGRLNYWTGSEGRQFEREFADFVDCAHGIAVANGTVALELALESVGIGPGDEVIVPSRTFVASASAVIRAGAIPVFADVDRDSQTITAETILAVLTPRTKAAIAVHLAGWPCEMDAILEIARKHRLRIIEDCAQAHGARYQGRPVGSLGDVAAFSFCQDKIMTTGGEGGMITTNDEDIWRRAWSLKDHGKNYDSAHQLHDGGSYRWLHDSIGTNGRLTEVQSAIGRIALGKLDSWVTARRRNAAKLSEIIKDCLGVRITVSPAGVQHAYYKYYLFLRPEMLRADFPRQRICDEIQRAGVPCSAGSCSEIYLEKAFGAGLRPSARLPVARELGETSLMLLVHPTLDESHMSYAGEVIQSVMRLATEPSTLKISASAA